MGSRKFKMGLVLMALVAVLLCGGAMAQPSSCTSALTSMAPCLNYITGNSSSPSSTCCSQLASVVQASPQCLCSVLNGATPSIGININQTLALQLPGACNVQTPPLNQCKAVANGPTAPTTPPVESPAGSPVESPVEETPGAAITPPASGSPSGGGSKTVPSTNAGSSAGKIARAPLHLILFAVFASIVTKF